MKSLTKMLCLVDGEHYLPVTQEAIDTLNKLEHIDIAGAVFIGGTEKLRDDSEESYSQKLGIPVSVLINSLYRQIIYKKGIPFSLTIPSEPKTLDDFTESELNAKIQHSYKQSLEGKGRPFEEVFGDLESRLNK